MTTIALNNTQIASDRQATHSGGMKFRLKGKLFTFHQPLLYPKPFHVGIAGNVDAFPDVLAFFADPSVYKRAPKFKGGEGVILTEDGKMYTFGSPDSWIKIDQRTYAIGSGSHFAMGAMAAGATPYEAIKEATKLDPHTGMGVVRIDV